MDFDKSRVYTALNAEASYEQTATMAYGYADAMIEESKK